MPEIYMEGMSPFLSLFSLFRLVEVFILSLIVLKLILGRIPIAIFLFCAPCDFLYSSQCRNQLFYISIC